jgi:hypothetical protein
VKGKELERKICKSKHKVIKTPLEKKTRKRREERS